MIIEATEENEATKVNLFKHLQNIVRDDCLLATITSSLSLTNMASQLKPAHLLLELIFSIR